MNSTTNPTTIDPSTRLALANLRAHLVTEGDFSPKAITAILDHVRAEGTVYDAPFVRDEEADALTEVLVRGFVEVPYDSPEWGHLDDQAGPDAPDHRVTTRPGYWAALEADGILPAISGGCDDIPPPYEPTPEDWAALDRTDADADDVPAEPPASRYSVQSLLNIRRTLWGI